MTKFKYVKIFTIFQAIFSIFLTEVLCLRNYSVSNCTCGRSFSPSGRIVGGQNASKSEFPWQVSLYYKPVYFCGGSLINNMFVMTAAHCFIAFLDKNGIMPVPKILGGLSVVLGSYEMKQISAYNESEEGINIQRIVEFIPHENFDIDTKFNDICLLKLENPLKVYTSNIFPICLSSSTEIFETKIATICGWGNEFTEGKPVSILKKKDIKIIDYEACSFLVPSHYPLGKTKMCSALQETGPCFGDSGGPLMIKNDMNKYEQIGLISSGFGCDPGGPKIFTRLSAFKIWIEEKTTDATYCEH